jgi:ketosteroid isomerase-like protein
MVTEEFLTGMLPRQLAAEQALCRGDAEPRGQTWSHHELATSFSGLNAYEFELVAAGASGDLAYTVGFEHKTAVINGKTATYTLRVTQVYRREDGVWRTVHRHGDHVEQARS